MSLLRTLKIAKGLFAAAVTITGLLVLLTSVQPADAEQGAREHTHRLDTSDGCYAGHGETNHTCYFAICEEAGSECSEWDGACFSYSGGYC